MKEELESLRITPAENGGMTIQCSYKRRPQKNSKASMGICMDYPPSEDFVFGASERGKALAHINKMLDIKGEGKEHEDKERDDEDDDK